MDIFSALQTSVSGLQAQAFSLNNISGNIANSQTTGYKRIDSTFVDILAEQSPRHEVAGSVAAYSRLTNDLQGTLNATGVPTNMALNGEGFFVVQRKSSDVGGAAAFSGTNLYTRRGDFAPDKDGYLVNGAGAYLIGSTLDPVTGQATTNGPIQISSAILPAKPTTTVTYFGNLPLKPNTTSTTTTAGSELLGTFGAGNDPRILSGTGTTTVSQANAQALIDHSIEGPSLAIYSPSGTTVGLLTRWAKVQNADSATNTNDVWNLFYADKSNVTGSQTTWTNAGQAFTFGSSGTLTTPNPASVTLSNLNINGQAVGNVTIDMTGGLTQYASDSGIAATRGLQQNGYASGTLKGVDVTENGEVSGSYSNGATLPLAKIAVVQFNNPNGLKPDSQGNYAQTIASGVPIAGLNSSTIISSNVEQSNTDIASEFSKMIVTQQAYSANTRVMSTTQTMISDLLNVIR